MTSMPGDRRQACRCESLPEHGIVGARITPGKRIRIVNASASGALVESMHRLMPGADVDVHLESRHGHAHLRGRLVRCYIARLDSRCVCYRAAIAFEQFVPWLTQSGANGSIVPSRIVSSEAMTRSRTTREKE